MSNMEQNKHAELLYINRDGQPDRNYAVSRTLRRLGRAFGRGMYKVFDGFCEAFETLQNASH